MLHRLVFLFAALLLVGTSTTNAFTSPLRFGVMKVSSQQQQQQQQWNQDGTARYGDANAQQPQQQQDESIQGRQLEQESGAGYGDANAQQQQQQQQQWNSNTAPWYGYAASSQMQQ
mmetsp:Transcript_26176/g.43678  ORF Transcript_26176/g.43678 Transcript_26176/m.43678 type:complete len:116 (-) Transcript_26176:139-486(-)